MKNSGKLFFFKLIDIFQPFNALTIGDNHCVLLQKLMIHKKSEDPILAGTYIGLTLEQSKLALV